MNEEHIINLEPPYGENNILLHSCCAPCTGGIIKILLHSSIVPTVLFYNPNIQPKEEYESRKKSLLEFLDKEHIEFLDSDYDHKFWLEKVGGIQSVSERGERCDQCFKIRLEFAAKTAKKHGFQVFTSSFGISRWKDYEQVTRAGKAAAAKYDLFYWDHNWRKEGGQELMHQTSREEEFYQQTYCGCKYSQR